MQYYLRFGLWPENERSGIYLNSPGKPIGYEPGVSVYPAHYDEDKGRWIIDDWGGTVYYYPSLDSLISDAEDGDREIFIVTGDELEQDGTDGEPLIRNVKLHKKIQITDIYNAELYHKDEILDREDPPKLPTLPVAALIKKPLEPPELIEIDPSPSPTSSYYQGGLESIWKALGTRDIAWRAIGNDVLMITHDMPYGLEPNFAMPELIYGPALFLRLRRPKDLDFSHHPWPWGEEWQKDYEGGELPDAALEFAGLTSDEVVHLDTILGKGVQLKRRLLSQPTNLMPEYTHFAKNIVFSLDSCEACGQEARAANSMQVYNSRRQLLFMGLQERDTLPPELGWDEDFGGATCGCQ